MPKKKKEFAVASGEPEKQNSGQQAANSTINSTPLQEMSNDTTTGASSSSPRGRRKALSARFTAPCSQRTIQNLPFLVPPYSQSA
jgi:hypothetical protein